MHKTNIFIILLLSIGLLSAFFIYSKVDNKQVEHSYIQSYKKDYKIYNPPLPTTVNFAGEKAPLNIYYVSEKLEREILVNTYWHSNTLLLFKRANRWFPIIEPILKKNNIPDDFKYLALIESGLTQAVSPAGAKGFWQLLKSTGTEYGLEVNKEVDERYHVEKSTQAACDYLNDSYNIFGSWTLVAASYNMGKGGLQKQLDLQKVHNYYDLAINDETSRYVYRLLALKTIFSQASKYGFQLREADLYPPLEIDSAHTDSTFINWADFAIANHISYRMLKELNPWLLSSTLHNSKKKNYTIKLPGESLYKYQDLKSKMSTRIGIYGEKQ